jgi:hypothetical protein
MKIEHKTVASLIPYIANARRHSDKQIDLVAKSIRQFGFMNPVLIDASGNIIAGHCRVAAAKRLGMSEVPCIQHDHLTPEQQRAYILADNQLALTSDWDEAMLASEMAALQLEGLNLESLGFAADFIDDLLNPSTPDNEVKVWEVEDDGGDTYIFARIKAEPSELKRVRQVLEASFPEHDLAVKLDYRETA